MTVVERFMSTVRKIVGNVPDEAERRRAEFLTGVMLCLLPFMSMMLVVQAVVGNPASLAAVGMVVLLLPIVLLLVSKGFRTAAFSMFVFGICIAGNTGAMLTGGLWSGGFASNALVIVLGAIALPRKVVPILVVIPAVFGVMSVLDVVPQLAELPRHMHLVPWMVSLTAVAGLVTGLVWVIERAIARAREAQIAAEGALARLESTSVSRDRVQGLLDALDEYVLETNLEHEVVSANQVVRRRGLWGHDVVGMHLTEFFEGLEPEHFHRQQMRMLRADGTGFAVVLSRTELPERDLLVWTATDISELAATTEALRSAHRQATAANDAKSNFLANMSHELRTPLNAIIGYSELLADDIVEPEAQADLARIVRAASSLLALINGVLDLSKVESGKVDLKLAETTLGALVEEPVSWVRPAVEAKGLKLLVELPDDLEASVHTDEGKLRQVITNLLSNATKFTSEGSVTLRVTAWERSKLPWLRFEVIDTGQGLSGEDLERVFEPFAQATPSDEEAKQQGTGLGLSICKAFVEMLGGQIYAESTKGQGARFVVEVPAAELGHLTPSKTPTLALENVEETKHRILLVDDDQEFLELMQRVLMADDRQVVATPDPAQALDIAERYRPDLIILDVQMPEMSGWSFMVRLRSTACAKTPVMVVSGLLEEEVASALGSVATLTKPVAPHLMRQEVARILADGWSDDPTTNG